MASRFVSVPNTGAAKIETLEVVVNSVPVERQAVVSADPTDANGYAKVQNSDPALTDYGLTVRTIGEGSSCYHVVSADGTNAVNIKNGPAIIYGWSVYNNSPGSNPYSIYVKLYNLTSVPVPGSSTVSMTISIQAGQAVYLSIPGGINFNTGLGIAILKDISDAGNTGVLSHDCLVDLFYK